jgi:putative MATE family efflux protein
MHKKQGNNLNTKVENRVLYRKLVHVALPIAMQSLISSSLNLVDNLLVGHLGETELSAVALSTQMYFVFWMILYGFCGGTITYMAQFWGKRDMVNIRRVAGVAITCSFAVGLLFFAATLFFPIQVLSIFTNLPEVMALGKNFVRFGSLIFLFWSITVPLSAMLRATQQTSIPLKISVTALSLNTVLACIFIYGFFGAPKLGIMGACLATVVSRLVEMLLFIYVIFVRRNIVCGPIREFFSWKENLFKRVVRNAIPTAFNEAFWALGSSMYTAAFGRVSVVAVAAYQAGNTIMNLFAMFCFAMGDAMLILVGEQLGKGEFDKGTHLAHKIMNLIAPLGLIAGALLFLTSRFVVNLFDFTPQGLYDAKLILLIFSCVLWIKLLNAAMVTGALRAGGDTVFAALAEVSTVWLIGVPAAFFFALVVKLPVPLVVLCIQTEELLKFAILYKRYRSKKWVRNLVDVVEPEFTEF